MPAGGAVGSKEILSRFNIMCTSFWQKPVNADPVDMIEMEPGLTAFHPPLFGRDPVETASDEGETTGLRQESDVGDPDDRILQVCREDCEILGIQSNQPEPPREREFLLHGAPLSAEPVSWLVPR